MHARWSSLRGGLMVVIVVVSFHSLSRADLRHAINNLQATYSGLGLVNGENVFKVVDQPHPIIIKRVLEACVARDLPKALQHLEGLWAQGYSSIDVISTIFRVAKNLDFDEKRKLLFIKARAPALAPVPDVALTLVPRSLARVLRDGGARACAGDRLHSHAHCRWRDVSAAADGTAGAAVHHRIGVAVDGPYRWTYRPPHGRGKHSSDRSFELSIVLYCADARFPVRRALSGPSIALPTNDRFLEMPGARECLCVVGGACSAGPVPALHALSRLLRS
jgi:hypothetical protein